MKKKFPNRIILSLSAVVVVIAAGTAYYVISRPHYLSCSWPNSNISQWLTYESKVNHLTFMYPPGYEIAEQGNIITAVDRKNSSNFDTPDSITIKKSKSSLLEAIRATGLREDMMVSWHPPVSLTDSKGIPYGNVLVADLSGRLQDTPNLILHAKINTKMPDSWDSAYDKWLNTEKAGGSAHDIIRSEFTGSLPKDCEKRDPQSIRPSTVPELIDQSIQFK